MKITTSHPNEATFSQTHMVAVALIASSCCYGSELVCDRSEKSGVSIHFCIQSIDESCSTSQAVHESFQVPDQSQVFLQRVSNVSYKIFLFLYGRREEDSQSEHHSGSRKTIHPD